MLEVSISLPSPSSSKADQLCGGFVGDYVFPTCDDDCFMVDDDEVNLLDYIDFSSCGVVPSLFDADGDILPDLEVDPTDELLAEFSISSSPEEGPADGGGAHRGDLGGDPADAKDEQKQELLLVEEEKDEKKRLLEDVIKNNHGDDQVVSSLVTTTEEDSSAAAGSDSGKSSSASAEGHSSKKKPSASAGKKSHGKRKVDWTPELHRRFVQAVEQLGLDKAVPSRILEIMGVKGLTRHNIASHLQKYRSHRKHLMAREAEAASWAQKRQMYAAAVAPRKQQDILPASPWAVPTVGFPPPGFLPRPPLHVWGHPPPASVDAAAPPSMLPGVWPRHLAPPPPWAHPPAVDPAAYWHQQQQQYNAAGKWGPQAVTTQGTPCVPPMPPAAMLQRPGMMVPHPMMYRPPPMVTPAAPPLPPHSSKLAGLQLQLDAQPSKESIDAAIGDVLVKPWLPLPLGLKPPSLDSVMSELHKQGIPKVPPAASSSAGS